MTSDAPAGEPRAAWHEFTALLEQAGDVLDRDDLGFPAATTRALSLADLRSG